MPFRSRPSLVTQVSVGVSLFFASYILVPLLARAFSGLKSLTPENPDTEHATSIYKALVSPEVALLGKDIASVRLGMSWDDGFDGPFNQLASLNQGLLFAVGIGLIVVSISGATILMSKSIRLPFVGPARVAALFTFGASIASLGAISRSGERFWDELYLFASAAENFSKNGIPGVEISGGSLISESSVDLLVILVAGLMIFLFPKVAADSAVIVSGLGLSAFTIIMIFLVLSRTMQLSTKQSFIAWLFVFFFPVWLLPLIALMPTGLAILAWSFFSLTLYSSLMRRNMIIASASSVALLTVRWDLGAVAIAAILILTAHTYLASKGRPQELNPWKGQWSVIIPVGVLGLMSLWRVLTFGSLAPSGLTGKSVGLDPGYLSKGFDYLNSTLLQSFWLLPVLVLVVLAFFRKPQEERAAYLYVVFWVFVPSFFSIPAGGDWFPLDWARYTAPSILAASLLSIAVIIKTPSPSLEAKRINTATKTIATVSALLLVLPSTSYNLGSRLHIDNSANSYTERVVCLAKAGFALKKTFPQISSVASAEVNTVAFFARASLTDLIGIVDPRIARMPPSPLAAGDVFHRRANHDLIYEDKSDAIYLFEGADCSGSNPSADDDVEQWNSLLNSIITRFRAGDPNKLLLHYTPVTIFAKDEFIARFLVRNSLAANLQSGTP